VAGAEVVTIDFAADAIEEVDSILEFGADEDEPALLVVDDEDVK
jgi:hypothetical protein